MIFRCKNRTQEVNKGKKNILSTSDARLVDAILSGFVTYDASEVLLLHAHEKEKNA